MQQIASCCIQAFRGLNTEYRGGSDIEDGFTKLSVELYKCP